MQMIRNEIDRTRAEAGGFVAMVFVAAVIFGGLFLGGCGNTKWSFQVEDLGETQNYNQELKTAKKGAK